MGREHRASEFQPSFGLNWRPVLTREQVKDWDTERLARYIKIRKEVEAGAINNPVGQGWSLPMWDKVQANWSKYRTHCILGGNRCLDGNTPLFDPVAGITRTIEEWASLGEPMHVQSMTTEGIQNCPATAPFAKGRAHLWELLLSDGRRIRCAAEHRFLTPHGWLPLSRLVAGCSLVSVAIHPQTTLDISREGSWQDVPCYLRTPPNCQGDYSSDYRLCGERLHREEEIGPISFQLQGGARKHSRSGCLDALADKSRRISPYRRPTSDLPSISDSMGLFAGCDLEYQIPASSHRWQTDEAQIGCQSLVEEASHPNTCDEDLFPSVDLLEGCFGQYSSVRIESITQLPVKVYYDLTVPIWANYIAEGLVHHNSSKSIFAARLAVWAAATIPESMIRMYHVNSERSIQDQQQMVYDALPVGIKNLPTKKSANHSLTFSQKNGFTDSICILPPLPGYRKGGSIIFGNYRQFQQDEQVAEGFKAHAIFCDEECPQKLFETLLFRTVDYDGKIFLTFTTLQGWTPLIQDILGKTKTLESTEAPLLGGRQVPLIQESLSRKETCIYYFHTAANPFIDSKSFLDTLAGRPKDEILARAYGIPTKSIAGVFPGFSREYAPAGNVIKHEDLPWLKPPPKDAKGKEIPYKVTRYMAIDPAGSKNWFITWVAIDASGTWFVYREWPDYDDWALPGNTPEGKPGPAQKGSKKGIREYVEMIKGMEDGEEIFERYIDPRMGAAEKQSDDGATTIISDLADNDLPVIPAPGVDIENGIQLLNGLLAWDENKPRDSMNAPKFYVSDRCQNIISCMQEYSGMGGRNENWKDAVDTLRYLAVSDIQFIDQTAQPTELTHGRTGSYGGG